MSHQVQGPSVIGVISGTLCFSLLCSVGFLGSTQCSLLSILPRRNHSHSYVLRNYFLQSVSSGYTKEWTKIQKKLQDIANGFKSKNIRTIGGNNNVSGVGTMITTGLFAGGGRECSAAAALGMAYYQKMRKCLYLPRPPHCLFHLAWRIHPRH